MGSIKNGRFENLRGKCRTLGRIVLANTSLTQFLHSPHYRDFQNNIQRCKSLAAMGNSTHRIPDPFPAIHQSINQYQNIPFQNSFLSVCFLEYSMHTRSAYMCLERWIGSEVTETSETNQEHFWLGKRVEDDLLDSTGTVVGARDLCRLLRIGVVVISRSKNIPKQNKSKYQDQCIELMTRMFELIKMLLHSKNREERNLPIEVITRDSFAGNDLVVRYLHWLRCQSSDQLSQLIDQLHLLVSPLLSAHHHRHQYIANQSME